SVYDSPAFHDLAVRQSPDLDPTHLELLACRGRAEEVAGVGPLEDPVLDHGVTSSQELVLQCASVRETVDHHLAGVPLAFAALTLSWHGVVVDAVIRDDVVDDFDLACDE